MSLVLNTNINSLVAQNSLTSSGNQLATALQQLSSGLRINTAADDAAGYAIVQGMTSQINGLNQAAQNAGDGVSLAQTASGAMQEVTNDLQTMRDLAVESLNASNSASDRSDLNAQFQQLVADINSVATQTQFNGVNLLDGSFQGATFQIGANVGQTITMSAVASAQASSLGTLYTAAATDPAAYTSDGTSTGTAVASGDSGSFTVAVAGTSYTTSPVTLTGNQATDLKTIAAAINQAASAAGVVATVDSSGEGLNLSSTTAGVVSLGYTASAGSETLATFGLSANNVLGSLYAAPGTAVTSGGYAAKDVPPAYTFSAGAATAATSGNTATLSISVGGTTYTTSAVSLAGTTADGATIASAIGDATDSAGQKLSAAGITATNDAGTITLDSTTNQNITVNLASQTGTGVEDLKTLGLSATAGATTSNVGPSAPTADNWTANYDTAQLSVTVGNNTYKTGIVDLTGNQATDLQNVAAAINAVTQSAGVTASANTANGSIELSSTTSQTVTVTGAFLGHGTAGAAKGTEDITTFGLAGSTDINTFVGDGSNNTLANASVSTVDAANQAVVQIDQALQQLANSSAQLGAYQNRFQAAITGLNTDSTNLTSARSSIQDTDYAQATSDLSKAQIVQQASTAMVAQANTVPQNVLTLLQKLP